MFRTFALIALSALVACTPQEEELVDTADTTTEDPVDDPEMEALQQVADDIADVRTGMADVFLSGAQVTYIRPRMGDDDPAAFWVQATKEGPALYVEIDATTLSPAPQVGDTIELTPTQINIDGDHPIVTELTDWKVLGSGTVDHLVQDLTETEKTWTNRDDYVDELVIIQGDLWSSFNSSGDGFSASYYRSTNVMGIAVFFRATDELVDELGLEIDCSLTTGPTPLWVRNDWIFYTAWNASEISQVSCPSE